LPSLIAAGGWSLLPAAMSLGQRSFLPAGLILIGGLSLTALLAVYLFTSTTYTARLEQSAQALRQSEERLAAVFTSAMDAMITLDHEQRITFFNAAAERMFRYAAHEVLGQTIDCFIPERLCARHREHIRKFGTTGETNRTMGVLGALRGVRRDGEEFPIEASIAKVETAGQRLYTVILRDITERQQAAQVLREQAMLAALETEMGWAMARSESLTDMLRQCTEAIVRHLDAAFARIWTLNEAENVLELQASAGMYTHINGAHARVPVEQFKIGLIAQERQAHFTNLESVANNIAFGLEHLHAQEALGESEGRFRQLAEHMLEVFYLFDAESAQIFYVSPAYEHIWGRSVQTLYQQASDFIEAVHPEGKPRIYAWTPYYQGEKYCTGEVKGLGLGLAMVATQVWNVGGTCLLSNQPAGPGVIVDLLLPLVAPPLTQ
jgi:PAS domain S-box-containing protein